MLTIVLPTIFFRMERRMMNATTILILIILRLIRIIMPIGPRATISAA